MSNENTIEEMKELQEVIENYINGEDYPDEIPKRIMGLFEREHADLLAEVKRLREAMKTMLDDMNNASPEEEIEYWLDTWKHWLKELIE